MGPRLSEAVRDSKNVADNEHWLQHGGLFPAAEVEKDDDPDIELLIERLNQKQQRLPDKSGLAHTVFNILLPLEVCLMLVV